MREPSTRRTMGRERERDRVSRVRRAKGGQGETKEKDEEMVEEERMV